MRSHLRPPDGPLRTPRPPSLPTRFHPPLVRRHHRLFPPRDLQALPVLPIKLHRLPTLQIHHSSAVVCRTASRARISLRPALRSVPAALNSRLRHHNTPRLAPKCRRAAFHLHLRHRLRTQRITPAQRGPQERRPQGKGHGSDDTEAASLAKELQYLIPTPASGLLLCTRSSAFLTR